MGGLQLDDQSEHEIENDEVVHVKKHRKRRKQRQHLDEQNVDENQNESEQDDVIEVKKRKKRRKRHLDEKEDEKEEIRVRSKSNVGNRHRRYSISEHTDWETDDDDNEMDESVQYFKNLEQKYKRKKNKKKKRKKKTRERKS